MQLMPYAISLKSSNDTASPIIKLWDEASLFEPIGSMQELHYPPHLTLAVFPEYPGDVSAIIEKVFSSHASLLITFQSIAYFDNDLMVLWAKPCTNKALLDLHSALHDHFDPLICHEHYRVGKWVPHCSLATKVPHAAKSAAIEWANNKRVNFSVSFDFADFVEFPQVVVHQEVRLG
jgi:2'-5' RNA ligase